MRKPAKDMYYIEVRGGDGTVRVSVHRNKLQSIGAAALRLAAEAAAVLAHNGAARATEKESE